MTADTDRETLWQAVVDAQNALSSAIATGNARASSDATIAFRIARTNFEQHVTHLAASTPVAAPAAPGNLNGHVWPYPDYTETQAVHDQAAAAQVTDAGLFPQPFVGLCLSGGGSRAASAAMGALRALRYLGLLEKVTFISTVSGGGWAGVPYTFCPDAISDDELLGPVVLDPSLLTWDNASGKSQYALNVLSAHAIGSLCTRVGITEFIEQVVELHDNGVADEMLWNRAVGKLILEPFGLGDQLANAVPTMYFSYTPWWRDNVVRKTNPALKAQDFYTVQMSPGRTHRPYLITNSTFFYPPPADAKSAIRGRSAVFDVTADPYPFEATPMVAGMPPSFVAQGNGGRDLGGGFIDPFVFGCNAPATPPLRQMFNVPTPPARFALSDIAGTSSSAYVDVLITRYSSYFPWVENLDPTYSYWPVLNAGTPKNTATPYLFGDGGIMENTAIMAMLRRGVPNILSVLVCNQAMHIDSQGVIVVDDMLPPLFGYLPYHASDDLGKNGYKPLSSDPTSLVRYNQVFDSAAFLPLITQLWQAASSGGSAIYKQTGLVVRANPRFGIAGGNSVNVLWLYNNLVSSWYSQLPFQVRFEMDIDPLRFWNFPNYDTVTQLNLDARQVNLLAHLWTWNFASDVSINGRPSNRTQVSSMF